MRFQNPKSPPPFLNRRDQWRMLALVAALALVLIGYNVAADPNTWTWLTGKPAESKKISPDDVDFHVEPEERSTLRPDAFRLPTAGDTPVRGEAEAEATANLGEVQIDKAVLDPVRDNTVGIRRDEADAYYRLLSHARDVPSSDLERMARRDVIYTQLMVEPARYRGEPLTIAGEIRRLNRFPASPNPYGLEDLYEAWLFTSDSGTHPWRIVATGVSPGLPEGNDVRVAARVTGYFFKRQGYETPGGLHVAPVLLAKRIRGLRRSEASVEQLDMAPYVLGLALVVGGGLALMLWSFAVSDRRFRRSRVQQFKNAPEDLEALRHVETTDIHQTLRRLAEEESDDG